MLRTMFTAACALFFSIPGWLNNLSEAKLIAQKEHKHILLNFSGSDWCGPCMRMHNEIFTTAVFTTMAGSQLVLVNADFPRKKKNQVSAQQQGINNAMADEYNPQGKFPYTLLLNADGKILKAWEGFPEEKPDAFTADIESTIEAAR